MKTKMAAYIKTFFNLCGVIHFIAGIFVVYKNTDILYPWLMLMFEIAVVALAVVVITEVLIKIRNTITRNDFLMTFEQALKEIEAEHGKLITEAFNNLSKEAQEQMRSVYEELTKREEKPEELTKREEKPLW